MEKRNKFKILKRIFPIICAVLCIATALTTPIMAIVDSSEGTNQNYDITARSTFPMTVGLAFQLDEDNNVIFASDIGGYGQEFNTTQGGTDSFFWTSNASTASQLEGQLEYEFLETRVQDKEYRNSFPLMTNYGFSKASYRPIRITTKSGTDLTNGKDCSSVVYRMSDVVINSTAIRVGNYFSNLQEDYEGDIDIGSAESIRNANAYRPSADDYRYLVPHVVLPDISTTAGYYGRYNVIATITDEWGKQWDLNYSFPIDTRGATTDTLVPFLPMSIFDSYGKTKGDMAYNIGMSNSVVLNDYYGYLDVDYYVLTVSDIMFTVDGESFTCPDGTTWESFVAGYNNDSFREFEGEIQFEVGTDIWAPISTDGTETNIVEPTDTIQALSYLTYIIDEDDLAGTWVINDTVSITRFSSGVDVLVKGQFYGALNYDMELGYRNLNHIYLLNGATLNYTSNFGYPYAVTKISDNYVYFRYYNSANDYNALNNSGGDNYTLAHTLIITDTYDDLVSANGQAVADNFLYELQANATKQSSASTVAVAEDSTSASTDTPTTTATAEWVKVEGTEYGRSATLTLPLWDTSNWTNTNNADYKTYSFPTVQKFLTDVQNSTNIPTDIQQDYTSWIGTATAGFLNMELMPNFSIGGVLAILIGFSIVMLFLKYFAGG